MPSNHGFPPLVLSLVLVPGLLASPSAPLLPDAGVDARESGVHAAAARQEPDAGEILLPPPPGAEFQPDASRAESEHVAGGPSRYGTSGEYQAEGSVTYVYLTDQSPDEVGHHFLENRHEFPHYVDLDDALSFETGSPTLAFEEEPAAGLPPDEMEAAIRDYAEQGHLTQDELEESLAGLETYRQIYPKIADVTLRVLDFDIEEGHEEGAPEYRMVDVEIVRPYVDPAALEVRDRTAIVYTVHTMKRQGGEDGEATR